MAETTFTMLQGTMKMAQAVKYLPCKPKHPSSMTLRMHVKARHVTCAWNSIVEEVETVR